MNPYVQAVIFDGSVDFVSGSSLPLIARYKGWKINQNQIENINQVDLIHFISIKP